MDSGITILVPADMSRLFLIGMYCIPVVAGLNGSTAQAYQRKKLKIRLLIILYH